MGTISDKLTYLNTTKSQLKDMINNGLPTDEQITSSTTFRNYVTSIFNAFLEALRTPDTLFTNLPKKSGSGANITLNDTANAPMRITLGSRALEQFTTTGKNLLLTTNSNVTNGTYVSGANTNQYKIQATGTDLYVNNVSSAGGNYSINNGNKISCNYGETIYYDTGNTLFNRIYVTEWNSSNVSLGYYYKQANSSAGTHTPTNSTCSYITLRFGNSSATSSTTYTLAPMVSKSAITDYEPYTGGIPAPNPNYPQDIHTISGSNTLKVEGKNLFDASGLYTLDRSGLTISQSNGKLFLNGTTTALVDIYIGNDGWNANANKLKNDLNSRNTTYRLSTTSNKIANCYWNSTNGYTENVVTTTDSNKINTIFLRINSGTTFNNEEIGVQIEIGSSASEFTPYTLETADIDLDTIECGSIGNYENIPIRTFGKNLFDKENYPYGYILSGTAQVNSNNYGTYIPCEPNTTYTVSKVVSARFRLATVPSIPTAGNPVSWGNYVSGGSTDTSLTITSTASDKYLIVNYHDGNASYNINDIINSLQIEKGNQATSYEPYGNGTWYIKKNIGKVVLDGTQTITSNPNGTNSYFVDLPNVKYIGDDTLLILSNYFLGKSYQGRVTGDNIVYTESGNKITIRNTTFTSISAITTWLGNNNTDVYYVLAIPTYTQITGTLAEQLENVYQKMQSQKGQTNISQVNDDLSFNLSVQALEDLG